MDTSVKFKQEAARLLGTSVANLESKPLSEDHVTYYWTEGRGGAALILGDDLTSLYANSSVTFEEHLSASRSGRRTRFDS